MENWPLWLLAAFVAAAVIYGVYWMWFSDSAFEAWKRRQIRDAVPVAEPKPEYFCDPFCYVLDFPAIEAGATVERSANVYADSDFQLECMIANAHVVVMIVDANSGRQITSNYLAPSLARFPKGRIFLKGSSICIRARAIEAIDKPFQLALIGKKIFTSYTQRRQ